MGARETLDARRSGGRVLLEEEGKEEEAEGVELFRLRMSLASRAELLHGSSGFSGVPADDRGVV